ncbi:hypothetical protein IWZ00DRAFT_564758 [Phyllosticta capitalensis]
MAKPKRGKIVAPRFFALRLERKGWTVEGLGSDLLQAVQEIRSEPNDSRGNTARPILFLGYSFGGIIVKQESLCSIDSKDFCLLTKSQALLAHANRSSQFFDPEAMGCVFLGTPHGGSSLAPIGKFQCLFGHWSGSSMANLLEAIEPESKKNEILRTNFETEFRNLSNRFISFYEMTPEYLGWFPLIPASQVVDQASAQLEWGDSSPSSPFSCKHRQMHRFSSRKEQGYKDLVKAFQSLKEIIDKAACKRKEDVDSVMLEKLEKLKDKLPYADGAAYNHRKQQARKCTEKTREKILDDIQSWQKQDVHNVFWLQGMAGAGKSTIARTVAERANEDGFAVGSFFFRRGDDALGKSDKFVTTIVRELAVHPALCEIFVHALSKPNDVAIRDLEHQWQRLIKEPLAERKDLRILLVIDALDECENDMTAKGLFDILSENQNLQIPGLKVFVTARDEPWIRHAHQAQALGKIQEDTIEGDIRRYFEDECANLKRLGSSLGSFQWLEQTQIEQLVKLSVPLFIVAATSLRFIATDHIDPKGRFGILCNTSGPPDLDHMYLTVLKYAVSCKGADRGLIETNLKRFSEIIGPLMVLKGALPPTEYAKLISDNYSELYSPVVNCLGLFKAVLDVPDDSGPVRVFHQSFRDFLLDKKRVESALKPRPQEMQSKSLFQFTPEDFWIDEKKANHRLFEECLRVMRSSLKKDICKLKEPDATPLKIQIDHLNACIPAHLRYACRYWIIHFISSKSSNKNDHKELLVFLKEHLLALVRSDELSTSCQRSSTIGRSTATMRSKLLKFVADAQRFIRYNMHIIGMSPLQLYSSALVFSPKHSAIREHFWKNHVPLWICNRPFIAQGWGALLQIEGHQSARSTVTTSLEFSPDGQILVSLDWSNSLAIRDAQTGVVLRKLDPRRIERFKITNIGLLAIEVIERENRGKVEIWDTKEIRALISIPKLFPYGIEHMKFSPDSKYIFLRNELWKITEQPPVCVFTIEQNEPGDDDWDRYPESIIFNPTGSHLLASFTAWSPKRRAWIESWSLESRTKDCTLSSPMSTQIRHMVFIHSNQSDSRLVTGCWNTGTVQMWALGQRSPLKSFRGPHGVRRLSNLSNSRAIIAAFGNQVAILNIDEEWHQNCWNRYLKWKLPKNETATKTFCTPDGKTVLSQDDGYNIQVRDSESGALRNCLDVEILTACAVSPDSKLLASGDRDGPIKLWDLELRSDTIKKNTGHYDSHVVISPNERRMTIGSPGGFEIWELEIEKISRDEDLPNVYFSNKWKPISFSPDGRLLLLKGDHNIVIFDVDKGVTVLQRFRDVGYQFQACFLPGPQQLLLYVEWQRNTQKVSIWNVEDGLCVKEINRDREGGYYNCCASATAFNRGEHHVALMGFEEVQIWNLTNLVTSPKELKMPGSYCSHGGVAFSPVDDVLITADGEHHVQVWDTNTMTQKNNYPSVRLPRVVEDLSFCKNGCCVRRKSGVFFLSKNPLEGGSNNCNGYLPIFVDRGWLLWRGKRLLWLPTELRHRNASLVVHSTTVIIILKTGRPLFLNLDPIQLDKVFQQDGQQGTLREVEYMD